MRVIALRGRNTRNIRTMVKLMFVKKYSLALKKNEQLQRKRFDQGDKPYENNNHIETIPTIVQVRSFSNHAHSKHFQHHFNQKKKENGMFQCL